MLTADLNNYQSWKDGKHVHNATTLFRNFRTFKVFWSPYIQTDTYPNLWVYSECRSDQYRHHHRGKFDRSCIPESRQMGHTANIHTRLLMISNQVISITAQNMIQDLSQQGHANCNLFIYFQSYAAVFEIPLLPTAGVCPLLRNSSANFTSKMMFAAKGQTSCIPPKLPLPTYREQFSPERLCSLRTADSSCSKQNSW